MEQQLHSICRYTRTSPHWNVQMMIFTNDVMIDLYSHISPVNDFRSTVFSLATADGLKESTNFRGKFGDMPIFNPTNVFCYTVIVGVSLSHTLVTPYGFVAICYMYT